MTPTKRDMRLLRALSRGDTPQGSCNDLDRLNEILPETIVNRAHPIHEPPYLFLQRMGHTTRDPDDVLREWLSERESERRE